MKKVPIFMILCAISLVFTMIFGHRDWVKGVGTLTTIGFAVASVIRAEDKIPVG